MAEVWQRVEVENKSKTLIATRNLLELKLLY